MRTVVHLCPDSLTCRLSLRALDAFLYNGAFAQSGQTSPQQCGPHWSSQHGDSIVPVTVQWASDSERVRSCATPP